MKFDLNASTSISIVNTLAVDLADGVPTAEIDLGRDFESLLVILLTGTQVDDDVDLTLHTSKTSGGTFAAAVQQDITGGVEGATAGVLNSINVAAADDNAVFKMGYVGADQFVKLQADGGDIVGTVLFLKGHAARVPTDTQST